VVRGVRHVAPTTVPPSAAATNPDAPPPTAAPWPWLVLGIGLAFVPQLFLPRMFTWFLAAIPHEIGHATAGCLLGRPSAPAISLAGEAWTGIQELQPPLVWLLAAAFAGAAWWQRALRVRSLALGTTAVALPAVAFTGAAEIAIAAAGHVAELAFAAWCYATCWHGGRTGSAAERTAGALAGGLLQGTNLRLCWGLLADAGARAHYASNGSLGLKNDYLVLAEDLCGCRLQSVALCMLVVAIAALPLGILWGQRRVRAEAAGFSTSL
jgi:hypothetical protein